MTTIVSEDKDKKHEVFNKDLVVRTYCNTEEIDKLTKYYLERTIQALDRFGFSGSDIFEFEFLVCQCVEDTVRTLISMDTIRIII